MKVILRTDVPDLGKRGDIIDVAPGYARNYLVAKGFAMKATPGAETQADRMRKSRDMREAQDRVAAQEVATALVSQVVSIKARAGSGGKLFGSVTSTEIAEAIEAQTGVRLDRRQLQLGEPIKSLGTHSVPTKLHSDVEFPITVEVVAD